MNCRIIDSKIVVKVDSIASVPPNHFGEKSREERYFGIVSKLKQDERANVKLFADSSVSLESITNLKFKTDAPVKEKPRSTLRIIALQHGVRKSNISLDKETNQTSGFINTRILKSHK